MSRCTSTDAKAIANQYMETFKTFNTKTATYFPQEIENKLENEFLDSVIDIAGDVRQQYGGLDIITWKRLLFPLLFRQMLDIINRRSEFTSRFARKIVRTELEMFIDDIINP